MWHIGGYRACRLHWSYITGVLVCVLNVTAHTPSPSPCLLVSQMTQPVCVRLFVQVMSVNLEES